MDTGKMPYSRNRERLRGLKESAASVEMLRSLWPLAFPKKAPLVRPLSADAIARIVEQTGWSRAYARGVLEGWKGRYAYFEAVLRYDRRWNLNGEEIAESVVDERARDTARRRLAAMEARRSKAEQAKAAAKPAPSTEAAV
jgi:sRNA-binding protein